MELDASVCYRAVKTRDSRFDGRFFTGVRSTGIYCRPICPAPTPLRRNCTFFPCAAAAQEAGFRPCLRCRPEVAPGTPAWIGASATVSRALRLIADGALDEGSVENLAARLGIGDRQLRRLFDQHLGASPVAVASTQRVLFAKKLLTETALPVSDIAFAAGFSSLRRFNHLIRTMYNRSPRELRGKTAQNEAVIVLTLPFRPPYNWRALTNFLAPRAIPGIEQVTSDAYVRTVRVDGGAARIAVSPAPSGNHLLARIESDRVRSLARIATILKRFFDTEAPIADIESHFRSDRMLAPIVKRQSGLRVPGAWDPFELTVRAILGQQVTVKGATTLCGRLVEKYGASTPYGPVFPQPDALVREDVAAIGLPRARAHAIRAAAEAFSSASPPNNIHALRKLPGIGDWTAQYIAMRAFNEPDAFPAGDLGLIRAAGRDVVKKAEEWRPWRAYATMHFWMSL